MQMPVTCTDISTDEHYIVSGGKDCKACLWDTESGKVVTIFEGKRERLDSPLRRQLNCHRGEILAVQISSDGKYVVTAGREGLIRIWDSRCGESVGEESAASIKAGVEKEIRKVEHMTDCKDILRGHRGIITSLLLQRDNVVVTERSVKRSCIRVGTTAPSNYGIL
jgi:WD40 repeat protein